MLNDEELTSEEKEACQRKEQERLRREARPSLNERIKQIKNLRKLFKREPLKLMQQVSKARGGKGTGLVQRAAAGTRQATLKASKKAIRRAAAQAAKVAAQTAARAALVLLNNPITWLVLIILICVIIVGAAVWSVFGSPTNYYDSLIGGSEVMYPNPNNPADRALIDRVLSYTEGDNPRLVMSPHDRNLLILSGVGETVGEEENGDITPPPVSIQGTQRALAAEKVRMSREERENLRNELENETNRTEQNSILEEGRAPEAVFPKIDIRIIKTLDYLLTNANHEYLRIKIRDIDNGREPDVVRVPKEDAAMVNGKLETEDHQSAFLFGQAMLIEAIDRTKIPELQPADSNQLPPPIEVSWQKNINEGRIRPLWGRLRMSGKVLVQRGRVFAVEKAARSEAELVRRVLEEHHVSGPFFDLLLASSETGGKSMLDLWEPGVEQNAYVLFGNKLMAQVEDLKEGLATSNLSSLVRQSFQKALDIINPIEESSRNKSFEELVTYWSDPALYEQVRQAEEYVFDALPVANVDQWILSKNLDDRKAFEARSKIRQVLGELKNMPRLTNLNENLGPSDSQNDVPGVPFDERLKVTQIITWSPEDDLDDGLDDLDVFPNGFDADHPVDSLGVNWDSHPDGKITNEDKHFSHLPVDNGIFIKKNSTFLYYSRDENNEPKIGYHKILLFIPVKNRPFKVQKLSFKNALYVGF